MNEKKWKNIWRILQKTLIFAPLLERSTKSLDYGVMAAQQVLVLFVYLRLNPVKTSFLRGLPFLGSCVHEKRKHLHPPMHILASGIADYEIIKINPYYISTAPF